MSGRLGICTSTSARRISDDRHDCAGRVGGQDVWMFSRCASYPSMCFVCRMRQTGLSELCVFASCCLRGLAETIGRAQIANEMYRVLKMLRIR